ncbi:Glucomannan 4-beta-mannosyltransferase [Handroanthus impetiginosus]|uniref:Glucomannan 4-beta-mannosyltransferase n=1 Tax=Handroanthus impetiginosus TaxID=429701 RepID=A0A2G9G8H2_9LAMI|nr:Glucomannan 4-beta-mannosyltransferase [Handroanthus impetiginosus]
MRNVVFYEQEANQTYDPTRSLIHAWDCIRVPIIVPLLCIVVYICLAMSIMLFIKRVYMAIVILFVKCLRKKRYTKYKLDAIKEDLERNKNYPKLMVQIPMFNEKEEKHLKNAISAMFGSLCNAINAYRFNKIDNFNTGYSIMHHSCLKIFHEKQISYGYQQHRWSWGVCVPANLFRKMFKEIIFCERESIWKKWHVIYAFFFILVPEVHLPRPLAIYLPASIAILNAASSLRSIHLLVFWILFENVMSLHRSKAAIIGLLEANRVNEWVVTEKLGNTMKKKYNTRASERPRSRIGERIHFLELIVGMYLLHCAIDNMLFAGAFFTIGAGYVGTFVPN